MTTRDEQEQVRKWLQGITASDDTENAEMAVYALAWIAELARAEPGGPMVQIRCRGPVSISEVP